MSEARTYTGGCHCGAVRFEVTTDLSQVVTCNCSICQKTGTMLTFVPEGQLSLQSGEDALRSYHFNKKVIDHLFCTTCGIRSFARGKRPDGAEVAAVNVRCLDGVEIEALQPVHFNGRSL